MCPTETLIEKIVASSQIPSGRRRQEIVRELRAHIEDFVLVARESGHNEEEIRRLVAAHFGDPHEIAREFAAVYRSERTIQRISVFLLATLAATSLITTLVFALQASMALSLGVPIARVFGGRHLKMETLYLFCSAAAYVGLLSLEKIFDRGRFPKALALLTVVFTALAMVNIPVESLASALVSGALLRALQLFVKNGAWRIAIATGSFGILGLASACRQWPTIQSEAIVQITVWVSIGVCGHLMTVFSRRVDQALSNTQP